MTGKRVAVIGGRGWLGRAIVAEARRRGHTVTVVGRHNEGVRVDGAVDVVVNAAGCTDPGADDRMMAAANTGIPESLAEQASEAGWRLLHIGSAAEYGPPATPGHPVGEHQRCAPASAYGRTKLAGTAAVLRARRAGIATTVARVFNVVGAEMPADNPFRGIAEQARRLVSEGGKGEIEVGDPATVRDIVTRAWVAEVLVALATSTALPPPLVNVCSGQPTGFGVLAQAMARRLGLDVAVRDLGWPRGGEIVGDPTRLRAFAPSPTAPGLDALAVAALGGSIAEIAQLAGDAR